MRLTRGNGYNKGKHKNLRTRRGTEENEKKRYKNKTRNITQV